MRYVTIRYKLKYTENNNNNKNVCDRYFEVKENEPNLFVQNQITLIDENRQKERINFVSSALCNV